MAYIPDVEQNTGLFVGTTSIFDVSEVYSVDVNSEDFKELIVALYQNVNNIALALNAKDSAFYLTQEFATGQLVFNPTSSNQLDLRPAYRIVINIGALNAGVTSVNHGLTITNTWKFLSIVGAASNTGTLDYYPLPFAGAAGNNIEVRVNATQVVIDNASGVVFTDAYVILNYVKY